MPDADVLAELRSAEAILTTLLTDCMNLRVRADVVQKTLLDVRDHLWEVIPRQSKAFPPIDRIKAAPLTVWAEYGNPYPTDLKPIETLLNSVKEAFMAVQPDLLPAETLRDESYFSPGQRYEALRFVMEIMKPALNRVMVIDAYTDKTVLDLIHALPSSVQIDLLTTKERAPFKLLYDALKAQRGHLDVKKGAGFHDRFIIVDGKEVWKLGSSLNSLGTTATTIGRMTEPGDIHRQLQDAAQWWAAATPL